MRRFLREHSLTLVFGGLFLAALVGQLFAGHADYNERQAALGQPVLSLGSYLFSADFLVDVVENWQSEYLQFFLPGILVQTVVFNSVYSGMGLSTDLARGLFDRFRSLPIWSLAPFAGLMVGDVLRHLIAASIILAIGLILGYRPPAGVPGVVAAFALLVPVGFGTGWIFIVLGLLIRTPTTVMTVGFTFMFPLVFGSNIMVNPATMPSWLRAFVEVNPISLMTTAMRGLMAAEATAAQVGQALIAPAVLTALLAPVTLWLYRRQG